MSDSASTSQIHFDYSLHNQILLRERERERERGGGAERDSASTSQIHFDYCLNNQILLREREREGETWHQHHKFILTIP